MAKRSQEDEIKSDPDTSPSTRNMTRIFQGVFTDESSREQRELLARRARIDIPLWRQFGCCNLAPLHGEGLRVRVLGGAVCAQRWVPAVV